MIQIQVQKMIDIDLEVEIVLEVGLEVGRTIKTCTYCHKPNHDLSHCYRLAKDLKKLYSGNLKID